MFDIGDLRIEDYILIGLLFFTLWPLPVDTANPLMLTIICGCCIMITQLPEIISFGRYGVDYQGRKNFKIYLSATLIARFLNTPSILKQGILANPITFITIAITIIFLINIRQHLGLWEAKCGICKKIGNVDEINILGSKINNPETDTGITIISDKNFYDPALIKKYHHLCQLCYDKNVDKVMAGLNKL